MFERVVATCIAGGLVGGEAFAIDASLIKADVDQTKRMSGDETVAWPKPEEASRAIAEYLAALDLEVSPPTSINSAGGDLIRRGLSLSVIRSTIDRAMPLEPLAPPLGKMVALS